MTSKPKPTLGSWRPPLVKMKTFGGKVIHKPAKVFLIWYGSWPKKFKNVLRTAILSLTPDYPIAESPNLSNWWNILTLYYSDYLGARVNVTNVVVLGGEIDDLYSLGKSIDPNGRDPYDIITRNMKHENDLGIGVLPTSEDNIYFLMISRDVISVTNGFCGFHGFYCLNESNWNATYAQNCTNNTFLYAFLPYPTREYNALESCAVATPPLVPPNGNVAKDGGLDTLVSVMMHELAEIVTDPYNDAWLYNQTENSEIADFCEFVFSGGDYYYCELPDPYGGYGLHQSCFYNNFEKILQDTNTSVSYNLIGINGSKFIVQQLWSLSSNGCQLQNYESCSSTTKLQVQETGTIQEGIFTQGIGLQRYAPAEDCEYIINAKNAHSLILNFTTLQLGFDNLDYIEVYRGNQRIIKITGMQKDYMVVPVQGSSAIVKFTSYKRRSPYPSSTGFQMHYQANMGG
ncbi:hypothetical protein O6H91_02G015800 [Diphasiastrum complanatum]|uniref:Uncharacterized protein n=1 Tax=Diphasiastrum complanatum TaxID=34168 RepID=A0ACC2ED52_DIPCM|nr:hypothetical protein O6H91_02G015800 [Diphasiastrum complanatum]